jgi:hypothetical protein
MYSNDTTPSLIDPRRHIGVRRFKISSSTGISGMDVVVQLKHLLLQDRGSEQKNYDRWWLNLLAGWPILVLFGQLIGLLCGTV